MSTLPFYLRERAFQCLVRWPRVFDNDPVFCLPAFHWIYCVSTCSCFLGWWECWLELNPLPQSIPFLHMGPPVLPVTPPLLMYAARHIRHPPICHLRCGPLTRSLWFTQTFRTWFLDVDSSHNLIACRRICDFLFRTWQGHHRMAVIG